MGRAQKTPGATLFTLEDAQKLASDFNPTLREAVAEINAAKARQQQAGFYPNPTVGYTGDEIRGGSTAGGKQGFFCRQTHHHRRQTGQQQKRLCKEVTISELEAEAAEASRRDRHPDGFHARAGGAGIARLAEGLGKSNRTTRPQNAFWVTVVRPTKRRSCKRKSARVVKSSLLHVQENALLEQWRVLAAVIGQTGFSPRDCLRGSRERVAGTE